VRRAPVTTASRLKGARCIRFIGSDTREAHADPPLSAGSTSPRSYKFLRALSPFLLASRAPPGALISLSLDLPEQLPRVSIDPHRSPQVLSNLRGNALKFTPDGGSIIVRALRHGGGNVMVSVIDSGPGLPAEQLPHVFSRFWQGERSDLRGIGLRLAITRGLVEAHGGGSGLKAISAAAADSISPFPRKRPGRANRTRGPHPRRSLSPRLWRPREMRPAGFTTPVQGQRTHPFGADFISEVAVRYRRTSERSGHRFTLERRAFRATHRLIYDRLRGPRRRIQLDQYAFSVISRRSRSRPVPYQG
jgi:hypothetical protein